MGKAICNKPLEKAAHAGAELVYRVLGLKGKPAPCSTAILSKNNVTIWKHPQYTPRKLVRIMRNNGDVFVKDSCQIRVPGPDGKPIIDQKPNCKDTLFRKTYSVTARKVDEFIKKMLPPGKDYVPLYEGVSGK